MLLASSILRSLEINDVVYLLKFLTDSYGSSSFITGKRVCSCREKERHVLVQKGQEQRIYKEITDEKTGNG
jgi:hypothetical protein